MVGGRQKKALGMEGKVPQALNQDQSLNDHI